jgi:hypothetical protein
MHQGTDPAQTALGYAKPAGIPSMLPGSTDRAQVGLSRTRNVATQALKKGDKYVVKQPKPLGLEFKQEGNTIVVRNVNNDYADPRIRKGDKLIAVSASFGGEIWPAKSYSQTMMAINTRVGLVYMQFVSGGGTSGLSPFSGGLFGNKNVNSEADRITENNDDEFEEQGATQAVQSATVVIGIGSVFLLGYIAQNIG